MNPNGIKILVAEDDEAIATGLLMNLRLEGYTTLMVHDGKMAMAKVASDNPDLVLLDIGLPEMDGLEVLRRLRAHGNPIPVIVLSARGHEYDKVAALRLGADDYMTKPFALAELTARIDAVLRRMTPSHSSIAAFSNVEIDRNTHRVMRNEAEVKLTHLEFQLLCFFLDHPSTVLSRDELLREVWGTSGSRRTVDNFMAQLRSKLEENPEEPVHFVTVRGSGYRFEP